jgi:hypothetical protein
MATKQYKPEAPSEVTPSAFTMALAGSHRKGAVDKIKSAMDPSSFTAFERAMGDKAVSTASIMRALKHFDIDLSVMTIHRMREKYQENNELF